MKKIITVLLTLTFINFVAAQSKEKEEYKTMKAEIDQKVFGTPDPLFESNVAPAEYKNESEVVLARKVTFETDSKKRLKAFSFGFTPGKTTTFVFSETYREKVLINDQAALDEYSQLSFTKLQEKSGQRGYGKYKNYSFINIRLIKPDGTIKKVDIDESMVLLNDQKDAQKTKIAIPDLNKGDIVDYYINSYVEKEIESLSNNNYLTYILSDDAPIINYELSLQFDKRIGVEYQCINGAPDFKITPDADGDGNIMSLKVNNLPKAKNLLWVSTAKQIPLTRIKYSFEDSKITGAKKGQVIKADNNDDKYQKQFTYSILSDFRLFGGGPAGRFIGDNIMTLLRDGINNKQIRLKDSSAETQAAYLFNYVKWLTNYSRNSLSDDFNKSSYSYGIYNQSYLSDLAIHTFKTRLDTKTEILVVSGKSDVKTENAMSNSDFNMIVRTVGDKSQYFSFDNNLNLINEIPMDLEGQKAKVYAYFEKEHENGYVVLPLSTYNDNAETTKAIFSLDNADPQLLQVKRNYSAKGYLRADKEAALTTYEEVACSTARVLGFKDDLIAINNDKPKKEKVSSEELEVLLKNARTKQKTWFENDINDTYNSKPKELKSYKINNVAVSQQKPQFDFEEEFTMEGFVKKAGNNYIIDAGRFIGDQLELKPEQRERKIDVYMPYARSYKYTIEFAIPDGYTTDGLDKLNKKVENECGGFTSTATLQGNSVMINVFKYYKNSFEPVANWSKLIAFIDAGTQFRKEKILLKKK